MRYVSSNKYVSCSDGTINLSALLIHHDFLATLRYLMFIDDMTEVDLRWKDSEKQVGFSLL